ncbi:arginine deiminase family protein [Crocinitomicaceae bacterium]|nr:arginine deiminase family protein [Crocinitomicaceae bacterium]
MNLHIDNEVGLLKTVILGIANDFGGTPLASDCYDPKSLESVRNGNYPVEEDLIGEMEHFCEVLKKHSVEVLRPGNILDLNQIYARDIAFVIEDKLLIPNIIEDRSRELEAVQSIFGEISQNQILKMPDSARIEGGDVILKDDYVFIGYSKEEDFNQYKVARTNIEGVDFIRKHFPNKKIINYELKKSDEDPMNSALHLDCCFQPVGRNGAIICPEGFKDNKDVDALKDMFDPHEIILIDGNEMYNMNSNIFSISENIIVSQPEFVSLNDRLRARGYTVEEVSYAEVSKMGGLFRCSTMPLKRI